MLSSSTSIPTTSFAFASFAPNENIPVPQPKSTTFLS
jgi:hypothetical protein